jgi:hypothetical protein
MNGPVGPTESIKTEGLCQVSWDLNASWDNGMLE